MTLDIHAQISSNFDYLTNSNCGNIESRTFAEQVNQKFLPLSSFNFNDRYNFAVDSIVKKDDSDESLFDSITNFRTLNDSDIVLTEDTMSYFFEDYNLYIELKNDTIRHNIISYSSTHRIIYDQFGNYIFLSVVENSS